MTKRRIFFSLATAFAAAALTQSSYGAGAAAPAAPAATAPGTMSSAPGTAPRDSAGSTPSSGTAGSVTQQPSTTAPGALPPMSGTPGNLGTTPQPGISPPGATVQQQATEKLRLQLQQCQAFAGATRSDCISRANQDFSRATGNEPLAQQGEGSIVGGNASLGMGSSAGTTGGTASSTASTPRESVTAGGIAAGNTRSTPDVSSTPRDNTTR